MDSYGDPPFIAVPALPLLTLALCAFAILVALTIAVFSLATTQLEAGPTPCAEAGNPECHAAAVDLLRRDGRVSEY